MALKDAIERNRKREQEKQAKHNALWQDVRQLDWDTFSAKRNLELNNPCWMHDAEWDCITQRKLSTLQVIINSWRGAVYNGERWAAAMLLPAELANIGGHNFQNLHEKYPCGVQL